jgi:predicted nucleic acid-binding protein
MRAIISGANLSPETKRMPVERFIDTNILLYGYDLDAPAKRAVSRDLLGYALRHPDRHAVSVQVLQEFHVNFTRKGGSSESVAVLIDDLSRLTVIDNSLAVFRLGLAIQIRWQLSLWDAMILAAARTSGARELITEDLSHGQLYDGVRAINPFTAIE